LIKLPEQRGFPVRTLSSAEDLLRSSSISHTNCLILDKMALKLTVPELLYDELIKRNVSIPVTFTTAHA
jgi:FixJ family two-component response regulator